MATALMILQLLEAVVPGLIALGTQALQAVQSNDQATLDSLLVKAQAAADALKPKGA